jgi:AraC-like DNA-binding protein
MHSPPTAKLDHWNTLRMQLLWVYERSLAGMENPCTSFFDFHSVLNIRKGWAEAGRSKHSALRADKGDWLVLQQGARWQRFSPDCRVISIGFRMQLPAGEPLFDEGLPLLVPASDGKRLRASAGHLVKTARETVGLGFSPGGCSVELTAYLAWQNAFRKFLGEISEHMRAHGLRARHMELRNPAVERAMLLVHEQAKTSLLQSADVAKQIGMSTVHLNRLFFRETGKSIHDHVDQVRLQFARDLLRDEDIPVKSIAYQMGFSSQPHFQTWFKKHHAMTPKAFRLRHGH